jgi:hypothetical protein
MRTGFNKVIIAALLLTAAGSAFAMPGTVIATYFFGAMTTWGLAAYATAFAINMIASAIINKAFFTPEQPEGGSNPGNRQQIPPNTANKLPVIYGQGWVGGTIVDASITSDNQVMYYVIALCEVTNDGQDTISFGDIYWGGKKCNFSGTAVTSLYDPSTGTNDGAISGKLNIYLYRNGSNQPVNTSQTAIQVMQASGLTYKWDSSKLMTNTAFAIVRLQYNPDAGTTGMQQTQFQVTNSRYKPGDCFLDYMTNTVYGAAIPLIQVAQTTLQALNTYCDETISYTTWDGNYAVQSRFRFDGVLDTNQSAMSNLQGMATCCDCLIKYNEITGTWGVIVQSPDYDISMDINDSNMVSAIQITPLDIASSYNIVEMKFPDVEYQDSFNTATFDLAEIAPELLYPNEPVNKASISLPLVNNDVRAQLLSQRVLKSGREDLQVLVDINYEGIQLEAGDIVTITNANYGWVAKEFRINKVVEKFASNGAITAALTLAEFNAEVYEDTNITQFTPAPNSGLPSPTTFGTIPAPVVGGSLPTATLPNFQVTVTASSGGVIQYAEIWYSAFSNPTTDQLIFVTTTEVKSSGNPYSPGSTLPAVTLFNIPSGNWYFFSRMVNSIGTSAYSPASSVFTWKPTTYQFTNRYVAVMYANSSDGTVDFSSDPRNKTYYGLFNNTTANQSADPADYIWIAGSFGTNNYLLFANRTSRKFSFDVGNAGYANLGGLFVPTETSIYDTTVWSGLPDGSNFIDLDERTGQLIKSGTTTVSAADGLLSVTNNTSGSMVVSLQKFLNFGEGVYTKTFPASTLTIDVYGRIVGFTEPDSFYYTENTLIATAGQTVFNVTHIVGQCLVFRDGLLVPLSDYSETSSTITFNDACAEGETVVVIEMRATSTDQYYEMMNTQIASSTSNTITVVFCTSQGIDAGDELCFASSQPDPSDTPTVYTVQSVNQSTKTITFTTSISGATAGFNVYRKRAAGSDYIPFTRHDFDVSNTNIYTPTTFQISNGFESIYVNGVQFSEIDYDLSSDGSITGFPAPITGKMSVILYAPNNFNVPASNVTNTVAYSVANTVFYELANNPNAMTVYANGAYLTKGADKDYTASTSGFTLVTAIQNNVTLFNQQTFASMGDA